MGVAFFQEAAERLPGRCDALFDRAAAAYGEMCDGFQALLALHPPRQEPNWGPDSTFSSREAAALVRQTAKADGEGLAYLRQIVTALEMKKETQ
jgi:hypothetical protein